MELINGKLYKEVDEKEVEDRIIQLRENLDRHTAEIYQANAKIAEAQKELDQLLMDTETVVQLKEVANGSNTSNAGNSKASSTSSDNGFITGRK